MGRGSLDLVPFCVEGTREDVCALCLSREKILSQIRCEVSRGRVPVVDFPCASRVFLRPIAAMIIAILIH